MSDGLQPGETIRDGAGYPALSWFQGADRPLPLVVFLTGGGVLARVAYGYGDLEPEDFLAHWLGEAGHPFQALSYPMGHPAFATAHPAFSVRDWGEQSAALVAATVSEHALARSVIVLGWSMAGRVALALTMALRDRGLAVELFVGLAAGAPLPNLFPGLDQLLRPTPSGLADGGDAYQAWLVRNLDEQNRLHGRELIPARTFVDQFLAFFPINLTATALRYRPTGSGADPFVADLAEDLADTRAFDYDASPLVALLVNESPVEDRHALTDLGAWSLYQSQRLYRDVHAVVSDPTTLPIDRWQRLRTTIAEAPARLSATIPGGHLFFVGKQGATATVDGLRWLREQANQLRLTIGECLHRS